MKSFRKRLISFLSVSVVAVSLPGLQPSWAQGERFGSIVIDQDGEIAVFDGQGFEMPRNIDGPPPSVTDTAPVGRITAEFYQGSCWVEICDASGCYWYYWPYEGCPF